MNIFEKMYVPGLRNVASEHFFAGELPEGRSLRSERGSEPVDPESIALTLQNFL